MASRAGAWARGARPPPPGGLPPPAARVGRVLQPTAGARRRGVAPPGRERRGATGAAAPARAAPPPKAATHLSSHRRPHLPAILPPRRPVPRVPGPPGRQDETESPKVRGALGRARPGEGVGAHRTHRQPKEPTAASPHKRLASPPHPRSPTGNPFPAHRLHCAGRPPAACAASPRRPRRDRRGGSGGGRRPGAGCPGVVRGSHRAPPPAATTAPRCPTPQPAPPPQFPFTDGTHARR